MTTTEPAHLGERLDAADGAGHKGAHSEVTRYDASRLLTGTYLLLGDILTLKEGAAQAQVEATGETEGPAARVDPGGSMEEG